MSTPITFLSKLTTPKTSRGFSPILSVYLKSLHTTSAVFSGHSRWSNIKHDKAKSDTEKSKVVEKYASRIAWTIKQGGPDPTTNFTLATTLEEARKSNVPKKTIENAIKRATGQGEKGELVSCTYEFSGPSGIAYIIECLTDNKARTVAKIKLLFTKTGGSSSPIAYMFNRTGYVIVDNTDKSFDTLFESAIELGAEDVEEITDDETGEPVGLVEVLVPVTETNQMGEGLKKLDYEIKEIGIEYRPNEDTMVSGSQLTEKDRRRHDRIMNELENDSEVTNIYNNLEMEPELELEEES